MAAQPANLALDGGDPRLSVSAGSGLQTRKNIHDPNVTFEEYVYWANITREQEKNIMTAPTPLRKVMGLGKTSKDNKAIRDVPATTPTAGAVVPAGEKHDEKDRTSADAPGYDPMHVTEGEWDTAARAGRTATWGAIFYLITTDVLGPYSVPWAFSQLGWGPGITLYTVFGALAGLTGWQIWRMFLRLDSEAYPLQTFGDIAFRVYGPLARHLMNGLQSLQLLFNVGVIIIANGQGLTQVNSSICYVVCNVIWVACGMLLGQIRTLQKLGWLANLAIWLNVTVIILTMAVVANTAPNYTAALAQNAVEQGDGIVRTVAGTPPGVDFSGQLVGLMQAVYSFGGAMLYCEFMSEMRKPFDFWKALLIAESFIYIVYIFFGAFVYGFQGQYTINPANQGMSPYNPQTAGNIIGFVSSLIAAALYGNIGIKVLYQNIFKELLGLPALTTTAGKWLWVVIVPIYWGTAFVLASAIPNFSSLSGLVAALCILQFTYTFPPLLKLGCDIKIDAMQPGEGFNPVTGETVRFDNGMKRWIRGFKKRWYLKTFYVFFLLGAATTAVLGTYSSIKGIIATYSGTNAKTAFTCASPVGA